MTKTDDRIFVKSHVQRDLLQNAAVFKTDKLVVWEYVSNGLQYVDPSTNPIVKVTLDGKKKRITISDNGRGMDWLGLQNFFVMHGENIDRREGRPGRGRFGTGKSAALGIANVLRITTVRAKKRSKVELNRTDVETMESEAPIPLKTIEREVATPFANGTLIEIEGIHLRALDQAGSIRYIERHLAKWPPNCTVFVNNHECEFVEPEVAFERRFRPEDALREKLGNVELIVKVSKAPLEDDLRGVAIYANGVWHDSTLAGSEGREMSQYIFGEIDVPKLEDDRSPLAPFDLSRSMRLNVENEVVKAIYGFIGPAIDRVRRELLETEKKRKASEEAKKLARQASEIARVINEDFDAFRQRIAKVKAKASGGSDLDHAHTKGGEDDDDLLFGSELPAEIVSPTPPPPPFPPEPSPPGPRPPSPRPLAPEVDDAGLTAEKKAQPSGGTGGKRRPSGGFQVEFKNMGTESHRARYDSKDRTIYINLDHPQLVAAKGTGTTDDVPFRRLAYEVAFSEYSIALASELDARGECAEPSDAIFEIRDALNRVARKAASLYSQ